MSCSSTYTIKDFSSKNNFFEDFNKFAENKNLKVTLINDSSFYSEGNTKISNDTLIIVMKVKKDKKIKKTDLKDIKYIGNDMANLSALVILKDGTEAITQNKNVFTDSSVAIIVSSDIYKFLPVNGIKEISYKNHWLGTPFGFLSGAILGAGIGGLDSYFIGQNANKYTDVTKPFFIGTAVGPIIGIIVGWIIGLTYTYEFSP
jgi:hypothetical protein